MAPISGVMVHAIERSIAARGRDDLQLSRITFEILGMIPAGDCEVSVETIRPGRTIELLEATMIIAGRPVIRARAWRLARIDTATGGRRTTGAAASAGRPRSLAGQLAVERRLHPVGGDPSAARRPAGTRARLAPDQHRPGRR